MKMNRDHLEETWTDYASALGFAVVMAFFILGGSILVVGAWIAILVRLFGQ
jgi:hypothetical protein